ncbi:MAG: LysE family translocator [Alphaproteobacteria bacterium]|nr:LysE family translocator [Alphaproteobacteria bacterium]
MSFEFLVTALVVVLIPGTGVVYTVATGLGRGRWPSVVAAFGCTLGIVPHLLASILGLAAILHTSALAFTAVKYAGVAYLLYLAWQTLRDKGPIRFDRPDPGRRNGGLINSARDMARVAWTGFVINILNPKLSVFFLAFLPQFVPASAETALWSMLGLGAIFMAMTFAVFVFYGSFAAWAGQRLLANATVMAWFRGSMAAVFGALGLRLAFAER